MEGPALNLDPRSIRYRALGVVLTVAVLPLVWIPVAIVVERAVIVPMQDYALSHAVEVALAATNLDAVARSHQVRLRVLRGEEIVEDHDRDMFRPVTEPVFRMGGLRGDRAIDEALGPLGARPEVVAARSEGRGAACTIEALSLVCAAAGLRPNGSVIHAQRANPRFVTPLIEQRVGLLSIALGAGTFGGVLALWIGWRMVTPLESLRDQVVARTRGRVSTRPVEVRSTDEIGEVAHAFNALLLALDARNKANEAFAADLAHELKNPVAAVRAAAEALAADRPVDGQRRERLHRVLDEASQRMEREVNRFLDLARAEAGLVSAPREPLDLASLARAVVERAAADPQHEQVRFRTELRPAPVSAASERLETALRNLVVNAASFAGPDGEVRVEVERRADEAVFRVTDTGPGIDPEDLPHIFDRYYTKREGGTGLGLALVRAIVEAHDGCIEASNGPNGGAAFVLRLPAVGNSEP